MKRNHEWFTRRAALTWKAAPGRSLLCLIPPGCDSVSFGEYAEEWLASNFQIPTTAGLDKLALIRVVPDQSTSATRFVSRLLRLGRRFSSDLNVSIDGRDPSEVFEELVEVLHDAGFYPILIIERFHSFARVADDGLIALLSQMRSLEHSLLITTVAISHLSYGALRRKLPPELSFVNSAYGDNHDQAVMTSLSFAEFCAESRIPSGVALRVFEMGGGPDCVFSALEDEYVDGVEALAVKCASRVAVPIMDLINNMGDQSNDFLHIVSKAYSSRRLTAGELAFVGGIPFRHFVFSNDLSSFTRFVGPVVEEVVRRHAQEECILGSDDKLVRLLVCSANPDRDLDLESECQAIMDLTCSSTMRDRISVKSLLSATPDSFIREIRAFRPNIVHFCGHGSTNGIFMRGDGETVHEVSATSLSNSLALRGVELVVLNSCFSGIYGDVLLSAVSSVVGTSAEVGDDAAKRFVKAFYRTLFEGNTVHESLRDGGNAVEMYNLDNVYQYSGSADLTLL